jgi:hypothetical protein
MGYFPFSNIFINNKNTLRKFGCIILMRRLISLMSQKCPKNRPSKSKTPKIPKFCKNPL